MNDDSEFTGVEKFAGVVRVDDGQLRSHVDGVVRETVEQTLNGLLDAEADALCGAKRYERSPERLDTRAGPLRASAADQGGRSHAASAAAADSCRSRRRSSSVTGGASRASRKPWSRCIWRACRCGAWRDITEALWGTRVSPSTVSELNQKIYAQIDAWRNRPIEGEHAYVYLDGIWLKRSWGGEVRNVAVLVAVGGGHGRAIARFWAWSKG